MTATSDRVCLLGSTSVGAIIQNGRDNGRSTVWFEFNLCHALFHKAFTHLWFEAAMAAGPENREDSTAEAADPMADLRKK